MKLMKVLSNLFGNGKKLSANEIAIKDSNSKAKTLDERIKDYSLKPKVLYESTSGSDSTITLSDSVENYEYIEIFYRDNTDVFNSTKINEPNGKKVTLSVIECTDSDNFSMNVKSKNISISGKTITNNVSSEINFKFSTKDIYAANHRNIIYITRVIGYSNE